MQDTATDLSQIDDEIIRLRNELSRTKNALTNQIFKRHQLVAELSLKVDRKKDQLKEVHRSNFNDLGKVLRSLYVFESRLRKEQQHIRRQLGERDAVIRQQQVEIAKLRQTIADRCHENDALQRDDDAEIPTTKPDLITSISSQSPALMECTDPGPETRAVQPPKSDGPRKNAAVLPPVVDTRAKKNANNNINFNKNVYSKTVTDLSLNDISSFPNPTPNNNLFVVSNSIFSKNEFTYNEDSKEAITSVKQNGKVIQSALKKADKYPSPKTVHFGKTTHIPEPDEDGQTDIVKTVETLLLQQCGDSTESENDTSSTASTETSPSVSQMVRKFESICTTTTTTTASGGGDSKAGGSPPSPSNGGHNNNNHNKNSISINNNNNNNGSYIADAELKTAAELADDALSLRRPPGCCVLLPAESDPGIVSLGDLDPRNNFEEFRFEDSDLDREYRPEADGLECPPSVPSAVQLSAGTEDCGGGGGGGGSGGGVDQVNYESFLEVTGLSQKSIITVQSCCNRNMYGSHRNVQKPKDVKSRSRAKSSSFEYKTYPSTVKYWTEPYI